MPVMYVSDLPADLAARPDAQELLDKAIALAEAFCCCEFAFEGRIEETHDGGNTHEIWLRKRPVTAVESLSVNGYEITDFSFDSKSGRLWRGSGYSHRNLAPQFPYGTENVVVAYSGGFSELPPDLKSAISDGVRGLVREQGRDPTLKRESFAGEYSWEAAEGVTDDFAAFSGTAKTLMRKYRRSGRNLIG